MFIFLYEELQALLVDVMLCQILLDMHTVTSNFLDTLFCYNITLCRTENIGCVATS